MVSWSTTRNIARPRLIYLLVICFLLNQIQHCIGVEQRKPTMVGEPLNPLDFKNGVKLAVHPEAGQISDTADDGTFDDIVQRKQNIRGDISNIRPWTNGILPYLLDSQFTQDDRAMIAKAIQMIEGNTCVRIITRTTEENYVLIQKNIYSSACNSQIGMEGGKQIINLADRCVQRVGSTAHELMHTLGFLHEQSRSDRDGTIIVRYENILEGSEYNFDKKNPPAANFRGAYDILSLTHYTNMAFSKNGLHTLDPLVGDAKLGQRDGLTKLDIEKLNAYYNCPKTNTKQNKFGAFNEIRINATRLATTCMDYDESSCRLWAKYGYCDKSSCFMSVSCKKTCNKCAKGCYDANPRCGYWATQNYCDTMSHYMHHYCPYSCWIC